MMVQIQTVFRFMLNQNKFFQRWHYILGNYFLYFKKYDLDYTEIQSYQWKIIWAKYGDDPCQFNNLDLIEIFLIFHFS